MASGQELLQAMWAPGRNQQLQQQQLQQQQQQEQQQQQLQQQQQAPVPDLPTAARPMLRPALANQPPQRRAHMLLQEMAGMANRLVEIAGNKGWQAGHMKMAVPSFLAGATVPSEGQAAGTTKEVLSLLESHQALLFETVTELSELQELEQEKQQITAEISSKDTVFRAFAKRVREAQQVLEGTIEEFAPLKKGKYRNSVPVSELVSYAHRISYTTFAPPEHGAGLPAVHGALPPAPQDEHMRASQLYHVNELDLGFTKAFAAVPPVPVPEEGEAVKVEPLMPAGWQPGMPVQLPAELPPMPVGWKIGDPIPLPPLPTLPMEGVLPKAPQPALIQVPHVNLDLNPELEEDLSSDYGSGDETDDEDD